MNIMETLIKQFSQCLEEIRSSKGSQLASNLEFINTFLDASPILPHSILKLVVVRLAAVAKSKECSQLSLEILRKLVNSPFISELYQDSQENSMILTILLSSLVTNIERSEPMLKKISWQCLQKLIKSLPEHIKKACFPGLLQISIEELKKFRCQGFESSEAGFSSALTCINSLQCLLSNTISDDWSQMAKKKASGALQTIAEELILITNLNLTAEYQGMIEALESNLPFSVEKRSEIIYCLLNLSSLSQIKLKITVPSEILKETILKHLAQTGECELHNKKNMLQVLNTCFDLLQNEITVLINVYKQLFLNYLFGNLTIVSPVQYEEFRIEDWLSFTEKDKGCWVLLEKFIKSCLRFEVFDAIFEEQHKLMKKLKKGLNNEEVQKILAVGLIFTCVYPDSALHILTELIFADCVQGKFLIFSRFLLVHLSSELLHVNELTLLETFENILLAYSPETAKYCSMVLECIQNKYNKQNISQLLLENEESILSSLSMKLKIFGPETIQHGLVHYLTLAENESSYSKVIKSSLQTFDSKHKSYTQHQILSFFHFYLQVIMHFKSFLYKKQLKLQTGNLIRNILMRTKGFLALRPLSILNRQILQTCLKLFFESLDLINQVPFEIDPMDHSNFAFEEDSNVSIPNGLSELSFEFLPTFVYCFKMMADSNCLGISVMLIQILKKIHGFDDEFFLTEKRFALKFFPILRVLMKNKNESGTAGKVKVHLMELMSELGGRVLGEFKEEVLEMCKNAENSCQGIKEAAMKLRDIIVMYKVD